jgi:hypothetical protein
MYVGRGINMSRCIYAQLHRWQGGTRAVVAMAAAHFSHAAEVNRGRSCQMRLLGIKVIKAWELAIATHGIDGCRAGPLDLQLVQGCLQQRSAEPDARLMGRDGSGWGPVCGQKQRHSRIHGRNVCRSAN